MEYPESFKYTKEHEWIRVEGDVGIVGVTHHAQEQLGSVVYVELPEAGATVTKDAEFGAIESPKAVSELFSPLSGEILEVNGALEDSPEIVNEDPHDSGWMIKIRIADAQEVDQLLSAADYLALLG